MITVGIINYNKAKYIEECIYSAINQSKPPKRIIIVDDCSTDNSKEKIEAIKNTNTSKVKITSIYLPENSGDPAKPINTIIEKTSSEFLFLIASDDFLYEGCLETLYKESQSRRYDFVVPGLILTNEEGYPQERWASTDLSPTQIVQKVWATGGSGHMSTVGLYATSFLSRVGYIKYNGVESDTLNTLNYIKHQCKYKIIQDPLVAYRQHPGNNSKNLEKRVKRTLTIMQFIVDNFPPKIYLKPTTMPSGGKEQYLEIVTALYYIEVAKLYIENKLPTYLQVKLSKEELTKIAQPFLEEATKHLKKAENLGEQHWIGIIDAYSEIEKLRI